jgi:hypothetical protein
MVPKRHRDYDPDYVPSGPRRDSLGSEHIVVEPAFWMTWQYFLRHMNLRHNDPMHYGNLWETRNMRLIRRWRAMHEAMHAAREYQDHSHG